MRYSFQERVQWGAFEMPRDPEAQSVMQEVNAGECGDHQGKRRILQQLLNLGYFWPTMKQDATECVKTCHTPSPWESHTYSPPPIFKT